MANPPDPTLTLHGLLDSNWNTSNVAKPLLILPCDTKRQATSASDVCYIYSTSRGDTKQGAMNAYRNRRDVASLDVVTVVDYTRFTDLRKEIERILDLAAVRSSPTTLPSGSNGYDQIVPTGVTTMEDRLRKWWRFIMAVDLYSYWEAR